MWVAVNIILYLLLQVITAFFFKWGSTGTGRFWLGFAIGNLVGVPSILFLMRVYREMQPNLAAAVCIGGSFLLVQVVMAFCFTTGLSLGQWSGVLLMTAGIALIAMA